jgi:hypothetical protein
MLTSAMIKTNRNVFLGAHVTQVVKNAAITEARKRNISLSSLVSKALITYLRKVGYHLKDDDLPLPAGKKKE